MKYRSPTDTPISITIDNTTVTVGPIPGYVVEERFRQPLVAAGALTSGDNENVTGYAGRVQRETGFVPNQNVVPGPNSPATNVQTNPPRVQPASPAPVPAVTTDDVSDMTVAELKAELDVRGVEYASDDAKADLVRLLKKSVKADAAPTPA